MSSAPEVQDLPSLPPTWSWSTIRQACLKVQDGTHFSPKNQRAHGDYRYITAKNVKPSGLDLNDVSYLTEPDHRAIYKRCDPKKGDVLLVKDGVNTGDAALNTLNEEFSLLSSVCLLRPKFELLSSPFLRYFLLSPVGYRLLTGQMTGTAIKRIVLRRIKDSPVPIAPLSEQKRIVAEIEKQFSRIDEAVVNLKRVKANLKRYKATVLKAAVEGKLTEDWRKRHPDVEPASKLLERILAGRRAKWNGKRKYKEPCAPNTTILSTLPKGWTWVSLEQLSWDSSYGTSVKCSYDNSGPTVLRIPNIESGKLDFGELKFAPQSYKIEQDEELSIGDVLIIRTNGSRSLIGRCAVVRLPLPSPSTYASYLIRFRLLQQSEVIAWVSTVWDAHFFRQWIERRAATSAGQHNISMTVLATLPIPLPPVAEQEQIVAEVERRLSVIEELEAIVKANLTRADRLRQSILKRAFAGELIRG